ncbi:MAG: hypothetical protein R2815_00900 [Flavobacteriales bacterium]|nr:hypothetical protein [Flavobacteriales bacterium]
MRTILLTIALVLASATQAQELLGQEHWPDGTLRSTRYSDGQRIHFITYHQNGRVKEVGCFRNGRRDGAWKQYSDTGALVAKAGFRDGKSQGVWEFRTGSNKPMGKLVFSDGALTRGEQYGENGDLIAQRNYR